VHYFPGTESQYFIILSKYYLQAPIERSIFKTRTVKSRALYIDTTHWKTVYSLLWLQQGTGKV